MLNVGCGLVFQGFGFSAPAQDVVNQGKGGIPRDTESGQLLIDRATHLDVLEYLLWINRYGAGLSFHTVALGLRTTQTSAYES